jgi:hypothetical protein
MKTSKGTIQGYNGVAAVDKKHQIIVDAQAFGEGQEHHTLKPVLHSIHARYRHLNISEDILDDQVVITADTGFANEENYTYIKEEGINAYIPDNQFRMRDERYAGQKEKYGKRHQDEVKGIMKVILSTEFEFNLEKKTCVCPAGKDMWLKNEVVDKHGKHKLFFEGKLTDCRSCELKRRCMRNPESADTREGNGRQVSKTFTVGETPLTWMQQRVDSQLGKQIYGHRMSVVEPVFGNIGTNKGLNRFSLRGKRKVQGQWQLFCLIHNIEKIMNYGNMAA